MQHGTRFDVLHVLSTFFFFSVVPLLFVVERCKASCCLCVMVACEDAAVDYSELRQKTSPECHTSSASDKKLSRQFSTENPPGNGLETSQVEHQGLLEWKWELWSGRGAMSQGSKVSPPREGRKVLNEPLNLCGVFPCPPDLWCSKTPQLLSSIFYEIAKYNYY